MADPRKATTNRIGTAPKKVLTYAKDGSGDIVFDNTLAGGTAVAGRAVMLSGNGTIRLTGAGSRVLGKLLQDEGDGYCSVLVAGVDTLPKGDGAIAAGDKIVGDLTGAARGYIRGAAQPGAAYAEAAADDSANGAHEVIDATTAASIEVDLGA